MISSYLVLALLLAAYAAMTAAAADQSKAFVNQNVKRSLNLVNPNGLNVELVLKVSRKDSKAANYLVTLPSEAEGGGISKALCQEENLGFKEVQIDKSDKAVVLTVPLSSSFSAGTITCRIVRVGRNARRPYPAEILQLEKQRFLFEGETVRFRSPYALEGEESTEILTPTGRADLLESAPGVSVSGGKVTCGPYRAAATTEEALARFRVQYDANVPHPVATYIEREIEISHWGNVAVEEHFDVRNDGAKLKGEFSRLDHQMQHVPHAFQSFTALLPKDIWGVYYRDELGNVTTSNMWQPRNKDVTELQLKLRFPLYGGWHIEWYHGYNLPLTKVVSKVQGTADRYVVDCELAHPIAIVAEKLVIHLVLPPGASNVKIESPSKSRIIEEKTLRRYTYLDVPWTARNMLSLELHNVLAEPGSKSAENRLRVYYTYSDRHLAEKPLTVSATIFAVLFGWVIWGRISA